MPRLLLLILALAALIVAPFAIWGDQIEAALSGEAAAERLRAMGGWAWAVALALFAADLVLPIPGTVVMAALGAVYGPFVGGALAAAGSTLSGLLGYGASRALGPRTAELLAGREGLADARRLFERWGGWLVAGSRWLPVLPEAVALLAGLARMPFPRFLAALLCGSVPLGFAYATVGWLGSGSPLVTLAVAALTPLALWLLARNVFA